MEDSRFIIAYLNFLLRLFETKTDKDMEREFQRRLKSLNNAG